MGDYRCMQPYTVELQFAIPAPWYPDVLSPGGQISVAQAR